MLPGAGSKGLGSALGGTGREREDTMSPWTRDMGMDKGADNAVLLGQHLIFASCSPGTLTLPFADLLLTMWHCISGGVVRCMCVAVHRGQVWIMQLKR